MDPLSRACLHWKCSALLFVFLLNLVHTSRGAQIIGVQPADNKWLQSQTVTATHNAAADIFTMTYLLSLLRRATQPIPHTLDNANHLAICCFSEVLNAPLCCLLLFSDQGHIPEPRYPGVHVGCWRLHGDVTDASFNGHDLVAHFLAQSHITNPSQITRYIMQSSEALIAPLCCPCLLLTKGHIPQPWNSGVHVGCGRLHGGISATPRHQ